MYELLNAECALCIQSCKVRRISVGRPSVRGAGRAGVLRALGVNRLINEQYTGTYLAAEGIELVKNLFDQEL